MALAAGKVEYFVQMLFDGIQWLFRWCSHKQSLHHTVNWTLKHNLSIVTFLCATKAAMDLYRTQFASHFDVDAEEGHLEWNLLTLRLICICGWPEIKSWNYSFVRDVLYTTQIHTGHRRRFSSCYLHTKQTYSSSSSSNCGILFRIIDAYSYSNSTQISTLRRAKTITIRIVLFYTVETVIFRKLLLCASIDATAAI